MSDIATLEVKIDNLSREIQELKQAVIPKIDIITRTEERVDFLSRAFWLILGAVFSTGIGTVFALLKR